MDNEKIMALKDELKGLTISPAPSGRQPNIWLLWLWAKRIHEVLGPFCTDYVIYPEFDKSARLHFHGVFHVKDNVKYYKTFNKLRRHGYVKPEGKITDKWLEYMKKDEEEVRQTFDDVPEELIPLRKSTYKMFKSVMDLKEEHYKVKSIQLDINKRTIFDCL